MEIGERPVCPQFFVRSFLSAEEAKFPRRFVEFQPAVRLSGEGRATGPPERVSRVMRYVKNLQIACRFPATPFD
jgi:hypothetical protein